MALALGRQPVVVATSRVGLLASAYVLRCQGIVVTGTGVGTDSFEVTITGSGRVDLTGTSADLVVEVTGSGDFDGRGLESAMGTVTVSGSGSVLVNVTNDLTVQITGSGDVEYMGNPTLHETITGSGNVSRR